MSTINALILGDVVGQPGCRALFLKLQSIKKKHKVDLVVVNGENAADGFGITPELVSQFYSNGVDVITTGNHVWQKREILPTLDSSPNLLRPVNYPSGVAGKGTCVVDIKGTKIGVINLIGQVRMGNYVDPFRSMKDIVRKMKQETKIILVDFHAEESQEKEAVAIHFDGKISALVGTHTHVQTADERILPKGTGYITDIGMTGPVESVIGVNKETAIQRSLTQMPLKMEIVDNPALVCGVVISIDTDTGKTVSITRVREKALI